ncbi:MULTISPECIES: fimbria/pilus outer membrane usher protein [unclassified Serratia (in: enterobacteria)]|uniref:fimbria/pilus outer membrane usher protein n=1 Tax=unclassified Serratia (in: enterobacteria) TaxID=2647522 RepID=UPI002ED659CC|nr:fimbria/pilus outer membrane usher protein [Serratia sp. C2(2)]MEE4449347.1 fimbria/pilus outer membrane usher protein [Serratia sp. C2(1)]
MRVLSIIYEKILFCQRAFFLSSCASAVIFGVVKIDSVAAAVHFDPLFLNKTTGSEVDVSRFNGEYKVLPGIYEPDIYVNQQLLGRQKITVREMDGKSVVCMTSPLVDKLGLKLDSQHQQKTELLKLSANCLTLKELIPAASIRLNVSDMRLEVAVPQAFLLRNVHGYVDPSLWEKGENALFANYDTMYFQQNNSGSSTESFYGGLQGGMNINGWMFRHNGALNWNKESRGHYSTINNNVQRDISSLQSRFLLGDSNTSGALFDSFAFRGVQMATAEQMLPDSQRGYAPVIRGIAQSNARVTVRQNSSVVYETTVPPGEFAIDDLYPTGYGGDLQVTVTESDGRVSTFTVPYASVAELIRPGNYRYSVVMGTVRNQNVSWSPKVFQSTLQYGFNNWFTGYTGLMGANDYYAALAGGALGTPLGAFALDITGSHFSDGIDERQGSSLRASYSKFISATDSSISIAAYRFSSSGYLDLHNSVLLADMNKKGEEKIGQQPFDLPRNKFSLTLSQNLGDARGQLYVSGYTQNYWGQASRDTQYQLGYNNRYQRLSYGLSVNQSKSLGRNETQYMFMLSLPLGGLMHSPNLSSYTSHDSRGISSQLGMDGILGERDQFAYNVGLVKDAENNNSGNISGSYRFRETKLKGGYAEGKGYHSYSAGLSGSLVGISDGMIASPYMGETMAVVKAEGAAGARVEGYPGVILNDSGYALVPYITPYRMNQIAINPEGLPLDVELQTTSQQIAPYSGAIVRLNYQTTKGRMVLIKAKLPEGKSLPFGAVVKDSNDNDVGVVAQGGLIYARLNEKTNRLKVMWGSKNDRSCSFDVNLKKYESSASQKKFERLDVTCG